MTLLTSTLSHTSGGNYGVMPVGKLGFVDIDVQDLSELPDEVQ